MVEESEWTPIVPGRIRIRETHLRDRLAPLMASRRAGVVKVDLVLRALANRDPDKGEIGRVPSDISWEGIHDLARDGDFYGEDRPVKRQWVGDKLGQLERQRLVRRTARPGSRSELVVLRDDGSGDPLDSPNGRGPNGSYVTLLTPLILRHRLRSWGSPELAAYFAAMIAERYTRADPLMAAALGLSSELSLGQGRWVRPLSWFADRNGRRPEAHVRIPFSERTLVRGFSRLRSEGLVASARIITDPRTGKPFEGGSRLLYQNNFDDLRPGFEARIPWELVNKLR